MKPLVPVFCQALRLASAGGACARLAKVLLFATLSCARG